jgi:aminopeptidase YwaD
VQANLAVVSKIKELGDPGAGQVLLVHGDSAKEQLMPKKFPFYNPDEHRHIVALLALLAQPP